MPVEDQGELTVGDRQLDPLLCQAHVDVQGPEALTGCTFGSQASVATVCDGSGASDASISPPPVSRSSRAAERETASRARSGYDQESSPPLLRSRT
ncbi:hypothetical protein GCM10009872_52920 [Actinopolymorpha rutila]